jgi:hypothetical protein
MDFSKLAGIIRPESCSRCRFASAQGGDLVCRANPPQVTVVMVPAPPPRVGNLMPQPFATFPLVRSDMWCGQFKALAAAEAVDLPRAS